MHTLAKLLSLLLLLVATSSVSFAQQRMDGFNLFTPQAGDFSINLPGKLTMNVEQKNGVTLVTYSGTANGVVYTVKDGVHLDLSTKIEADSATKLKEYQDDFFRQSVKSFLASSKHNLKGEIKETDKKVTGKGWHGQQATLIGEDDAAATLVVAFTDKNDVVYGLIALDDDKNSMVQSFIESFRVNPEKATQAHFTNSRSLNDFVGKIYTVSGVLVLIVALAFVVRVVTTKKK